MQSQKKIEEMSEVDLISYISYLNRLKAGEYPEDGEFRSEMGLAGFQPPVDLIREITNAREALKRIKRKGLTEEEKREIFKKYMGAECSECHNLFNKTEMVTIDNKKYCKSCAKEKLA